MAYDISSQGYQEIDGEKVKVHYVLETGTGRVLRQTSKTGAHFVEVGIIDFEKTANIHEEFAKITGITPNVNDLEDVEVGIDVVTGDLDNKNIVATSPKKGKKSGK